MCVKVCACVCVRAWCVCVCVCVLACVLMCVCVCAYIAPTGVVCVVVDWIRLDASSDRWLALLLHAVNVSSMYHTHVGAPTGVHLYKHLQLL